MSTWWVPDSQVDHDESRTRQEALQFIKKTAGDLVTPMSEVCRGFG